MPVMDEFREEREALKNGTLKQKWQYFLDYYKWYVIGGIFILIVAIIFIRDMINNKDFIFYGFFINSAEMMTTGEQFLDDFAQQAGLDTENYAVMIDSSDSIVRYSHDEISRVSHQKLSLSIMAKEADFVGMDAETFEEYATTTTYYDLRDVLSPEQLEAYEPYFYYVDMADVRKVDQSRAESTANVYPGKEYDHSTPEGQEEPVPVAIYIQDSEKLQNAYDFNDKDYVLGIPLTTQHLDTTLQFIDYIME